MIIKPLILILLVSALSACSDSEKSQEGLGDAYVVDLTQLPTDAEGTLTLNKSGEGALEISGSFTVGAYSVDVRVDKAVAEAAKINTEKEFSAEVRVTILSEHEKSSGYHQIYKISEIAKTNN